MGRLVVHLVAFLERLSISYRDLLFGEHRTSDAVVNCFWREQGAGAYGSSAAYAAGLGACAQLHNHGGLIMSWNLRLVVSLAVAAFGFGGLCGAENPDPAAGEILKADDAFQR